MKISLLASFACPHCKLHVLVGESDDNAFVVLHEMGNDGKLCTKFERTDAVDFVRTHLAMLDAQEEIQSRLRH